MNTWDKAIGLAKFGVDAAIFGMGFVTCGQ